MKENLEDDVSLLMLQITNLWKDYHSKALKKHYGLTHVQYAVLTDLYWFTLQNKKPVTQTMLAKHTKIDPMTLSHVIKGLEAKDYVSRVSHPADIRAKAVDLTPKGKELIILAIHTTMEIDHKFFKALGKDVHRFNIYLKKLIAPND